MALPVVVFHPYGQLYIYYANSKMLVCTHNLDLIASIIKHILNNYQVSTFVAFRCGLLPLLYRVEALQVVFVGGG
jgi:hypothetical protein